MANPHSLRAIVLLGSCVYLIAVFIRYFTVPCLHIFPEPSHCPHTVRGYVPLLQALLQIQIIRLLLTAICTVSTLSPLAAGAAAYYDLS